MGTLEKSCKSHEISTSRSRFAKSDDFQLRNASDDVKETIRIGSTGWGWNWLGVDPDWVYPDWMVRMGVDPYKNGSGLG